MRKILYISAYSNLFSNLANVTNVLYMCDAFNDKADKVYLIAFLPYQYFFRKNTVSRVDPDLRVKLIRIPYIDMRGIFLLFDVIAFVFALSFAIMGYKIYTRNCRLSRFLHVFRFITLNIEIHDFSINTMKTVKMCKDANFFAISIGIIDEVKRLNLSRKIVLLPDAAKLAMQSDLLVDLRRPAITYIGSANPGKGIYSILQIASLAPELNFYIVGPNPSGNIPLNVTFSGFCNKPTIAEYLRKSDVLIAPYEKEVLDNAGNNITNYMSPLKLFEYMASGTPFVASRMKFITDIVEEDVHCMLAEPENYVEWTAKIKFLLNNHDVSMNMAERAYQLYSEKFTWEKRAETVLLSLFD